MDHTDRADRNPAIAELLDDAFVAPVDVDTASRHLWVIHSEAARMAEAAASESAAEVVAEADALLRAPDARLSLSRRGLPRAAVPVLALMILMSFSGVAVAASHNSLPGDALYMVKRGTERAQLIFVRDPVTRAELQLSFARTRLAEIERIADTRPQHVANLVAEIAVTLDEVDKAPPEVAQRVQPVSDSIRLETTQSIAVLDLPSNFNDDVAVAMTSTAAPTATASTATAVPTAGSTSAVPVEGTSPLASVEPKDTDGDGVPDTPASAVPNPTAQPEPEADGTEVDGQPSPDAEASDPDDDPSVDPSATPTPSASPTPSESGNPSAGPSTGPSGQPSTGPSNGESAPPATSGPVVTPRPQASELDESGQSRSDDEDAEAEGSDAPQAGPSSRPDRAASSSPADSGSEAAEPAQDSPASESQSSMAQMAPQPVEHPTQGRPGDVAE